MRIVHGLEECLIELPHTGPETLPALQGSMLLSLRYLVGTVVVLTGLMMAAKRYVDVNICVPVRRGKDTGKAKKKKKKGSLGDSLSVLKSSPMILNLALLVVSYGVSHRLFEFAWKGQLRALYPSAQAYQVWLQLLQSLSACQMRRIHHHSLFTLGQGVWVQRNAMACTMDCAFPLLGHTFSQISTSDCPYSVRLQSL